MNEDQFREEVEKFCEMLMDFYGWLYGHMNVLANQ